MITVTEKLNKALKSLGYPVGRIVYETEPDKPPVDTYFTIRILGADPQEHADDDFVSLEYILGVILTSKEDYTELLGRTINKLRHEGFTISSIEPEVLDIATGFFYVPITVKILEEWEWQQ